MILSSHPDIEHSLVHLQALKVNRRERVGELVRLDDVDAVSVQKVRHCSHLPFVPVGGNDTYIRKYAIALV